MNLRLGIDVGGTNTDAVILDPDNRLLAKAKRPTTEDVSTGVHGAVDAVLTLSRIDPSSILHAMLWTTHCTNAIVERKGLASVGVVRLSAPSGLAVPPFREWPKDILARLGINYRIVKGGYEYNGAFLMAPDPHEVEKALRSLKDLGVEALAISCVFSPVNAEQERMARDRNPGAASAVQRLPDALWSQGQVAYDCPRSLAHGCRHRCRDTQQRAFAHAFCAVGSRTIGILHDVAQHLVGHV
jgi:N-methylhydantoinase A/oxoprolinase/acetone carboxylase beta subunit